MIKGSKKENGKVKRYTIRVTLEEDKKLQRNAKEKGISVAEYIRYLINKEK